MTTIDTARHFAEAAHAGQTRKGVAQEPYITHVAEVAGQVADLGGSDAQIMAAWLHDTVEDCGVLPDQLVEIFGPVVTGLVQELTDDKSLDKASRKQMQLNTAAHKSSAAALIKVCDKLSNVRAVGLSPPVHWNIARRRAYLDWAEGVVSRLPSGADPARQAFAGALAQARMQTLDRRAG